MPSEESNECDKDRKYKSEREIDGRAGGRRNEEIWKQKRFKVGGDSNIVNLYAN